MARRIMKDFRIDEISAVTDPAIFSKSATDPTRFSKCIIHKSAEQETDMLKAFDSRVAELKKSGLSGMDAMQQAREEMPEAMLPENNRVTYADASPAPVRVAKSASVIKFEQRVAEVRSVEKCSKNQAMEKARLAYPAEFAAYQAG